MLVSRIKSLCKQRKIAFYRFEIDSGLGQNTVAKWDNSPPSITKVQTAAKFLGVTVSELLGETEKAPGMEPEAMEIWENFCALDDRDQRIVRTMMREMGDKPDTKSELPRMKIIPLLGQRFAAGRGEPDNGIPWEDHEVPENSPADFAVRVSGNSMEPYLHDGSIALAKKGPPSDGDVGVFLVDGNFLVKQVCEDYAGTLHLFSLNHDRADADEHIPKDIDRDVRCFGTVLMDKKIPLPGKGGRKL